LNLSQEETEGCWGNNAQLSLGNTLQRTATPTLYYAYDFAASKIIKRFISHNARM